MAYQKMNALQGRRIPSLLSHVSMSLAPPGLDGVEQEFFKVPNILFQYIDGFDLSTELSSKVPQCRLPAAERGSAAVHFKTILARLYAMRLSG